MYSCVGRRGLRPTGGGVCGMARGPRRRERRQRERRPGPQPSDTRRLGPGGERGSPGAAARNRAQVLSTKKPRGLFESKSPFLRLIEADSDWSKTGSLRFSRTDNLPSTGEFCSLQAAPRAWVQTARTDRPNGMRSPCGLAAPWAPRRRRRERLRLALCARRRPSIAVCPFGIV